MSWKPGKTLKWVLVALVVLVSAAIIAGCLYWNHMLNLLGDPEAEVPTLSYEEEMALLGTVETTEMTEPTETRVPVETEPLTPEKNITNIMLVGQNWREDEQNKLSDTMILCSINRKTKTMTMVSFLRDLYAPLPAYAGHGPGRNRINVCYALGSSWKRSSIGGMEMLALCIEQNFGVHVDHTIEVGFESFTRIVDGFGGIEVDVTEEEANYMTKNIGYIGEIQPGLQTLDGPETLAYARIRKIDGDRQRAARQRTVITALVDKCRDMNLAQMHHAVEYVMPSIITDMTNEEITGYVLELLPILKDLQLRSLTIPADNETLPHSMWSKTLDLYGYESSVIECNTALNGRFLRYMLGIPKE
ncbi:MAG: LCP family protein [Oscillospiraceae bacterium]|nr:LCP family protein [Oscillospiraceae bacterium]